MSSDALFLLAVMLGLEVARQAIAGPTGMVATAGFAAFVMQPFLVVIGMATLHRRAFNAH